MKWDNDPHKYEKHLILDAIIRFSNAFHDEKIGNVSIKDCADFIDNYIEEKRINEKIIN